MARPRVVLGEDHPRVAAELRAVLVTEFDVVDIVASGRALVQSVELERPDAIVTDIAMPEMNGLTAAGVILAHAPDARIVFVTVHGDRALVERAFASGVLAYVLKGDAGEELVAAVQAVLAGREYVSRNARAASGEERGRGRREGD